MNKMFALDSKIAIVTGAAQGNGKAIAKGLSEAGASVIGLDIKENINIKDCDYVVCDITNDKHLEKIVTYVINKYQKIDILVNNAGVSYPHDFLSYPEDLWEKTYNVNLKAPYKLMKAVARQMKKNNVGGSIINITSLNSEMAFPNNPAYVASKGALKQLTKSAALDLGKYNIRVNNIGPGYIMTKMTENSWTDPDKRRQRAEKTVLGRWGEPEDLVGAAIFLASDASSYVTGQDIYVDGGWLIKGL